MLGNIVILPPARCCDPSRAPVDAAIPPFQPRPFGPVPSAPRQPTTGGSKRKRPARLLRAS